MGSRLSFLESPENQLAERHLPERQLLERQSLKRQLNEKLFVLCRSLYTHLVAAEEEIQGTTHPR